MTKLFPAVAAMLLAVGFCSAPARTQAQAQAQAQLSESPITPGFWSFPNHKTAAAQDIAAACRAHFEVRFADGRFIGLRMRKSQGGAVQREVEDVGRCTFNRGTQIDRCDVKITNSDGSVLTGTTESRYSLDASKILKMMVTPKMVTDSPSDSAPFDAFPVRCPDDAVWSILNESPTPK